jgi:large subunit ribosomal protein L29
MKYVDIKDLTVEELRKKIVLTKNQLFQTKMKHSLGQVQNPIEIRHQRRDLAKMMTALNSKLT